MKLLRPITITDAMLDSCDVPETDHAVYAAGTTYALGDKVIMTTGVHKIFESLQAANTGHTPTDNPDWWLDLGATNRWAMFDQIVGSQTSQATSLTITLEPGQVIDSIALLDLDADTVDIVMTDPVEGVVYTESINLVSLSRIVDGYTYFFEPIILTDTVVLLAIPPYANAAIEITVTKTASTAKVGTMALGTYADLGETRYNPTIGIVDYSRKTTDDFGNITVTERAYTKRLACELQVPNESVDGLQRILAGYRATPVIWIGDTSFTSLILYGFYKSFSIVIPGPTASRCSLEVEGLV